VDIRRLRWDAVNTAKVAAHGLRPSIVDDVVWRGAYEIFRDAPDHPADRLVVIGPTSLDRWITTIIGPTEREDIWRPVTAYPSSLKEIRRNRARRQRR
jgi:hypothetical protein